MSRIVVTGIGAVTPLGIGVGESWQRLLAGESGIAKITRFDSSRHKCQVAGEVKDFHPEEFIDKKHLKMMDRFIQYAIFAAKEAIEDSGINFENENRTRCGVSTGVAIGGLPTIEEELRNFLARGDPEDVDIRTVPRMIPNEAGAQIAIRWKLEGANYCSSMACAAGAQAIGLAFDRIKAGKVDVMIAGGSEGAICSLGVAAIKKIGALSTNRNENPTKASRPFDRDRDGFVLGEGAGMLILEELEHALQRGVKIYGELMSYGLTCDAFHPVAPLADGGGALNAMRMALAEAEVLPSSLDIINAHATSTLDGDRAELRAIKALLGEDLSKPLVISNKGAIGHLIGGAGPVEAIFSLLSIKEKKIPPQLNFENPDPESEGLNIPSVLKEKEVKTVLSSSFGFGGTNVSLLFREFKG